MQPAAARGRQTVPKPQERLGRRVGVEHARLGIHDEHPLTQAVERRQRALSLDGGERQVLVCPLRAAQVRQQQAQQPHVLVLKSTHPVGARHGHEAAPARAIENPRLHAIVHVMAVREVGVELGADELRPRYHHRVRQDRALGGSHHGRTKLVHMHVVLGVVARALVCRQHSYVEKAARGVLHPDSRVKAVEQTADPLEGCRPVRAVQGCIVNRRDHRRQVLKRGRLTSHSCSSHTGRVTLRRAAAGQRAPA